MSVHFLRYGLRKLTSKNRTFVEGVLSRKSRVLQKPRLNHRFLRKFLISLMIRREHDKERIEVYVTKLGLPNSPQVSFYFS